jgi:hypothetical protein
LNPVSVGYSDARRQRSLLGKECIDLRWLERRCESVQGLLNDGVKPLLALSPSNPHGPFPAACPVFP